MAVIARLSRLFQADMHAALDKIEEPELLLKQAIRDMEEAIATDERQVRSWLYEQQQLTNKHGQLAENLSDLEDKLLLCFKLNKDDLARTLIKRKLETQQAKQLLSEKITALKEQTAHLTKLLTEHRAQLAGMKQKADAFLDETQFNPTNWQNPQIAIQEEDVEIAFLHEKQKWGAS
jgi:phage shock protein A